MTNTVLGPGDLECFTIREHVDQWGKQTSKPTVPVPSVSTLCAEIHSYTRRGEGSRQNTWSRKASGLMGRLICRSGRMGIPGAGSRVGKGREARASTMISGRAVCVSEGTVRVYLSGRGKPQAMSLES